MIKWHSHPSLPNKPLETVLVLYEKKNGRNNGNTGEFLTEAYYIVEGDQITWYDYTNRLIAYHKPKNYKQNRIIAWTEIKNLNI